MNGSEGMSEAHITWREIPWESPLPGLRQKAVVREGRRLRLVEYGPELPPHWCEAGHVGLVLQGCLELEFADGVVVLRPGDGLWIPAGPTHRHRASVPEGLARLVLFEDV
jgi:quercetin dioxygenase-like cupin family protein